MVLVDVFAQPQPDAHQEQQRLQERRQAVADQVLRIDPHVAVPDAEQPLRERRIRRGITAFH